MRKVVYRYSILPGGVKTTAELKERLKADPVAAAHYAGVAVGRLRPARLDRDNKVYVSYRKQSRIYWTRSKVHLPAGELVLTSGGDTIRARCGNRVSPTPQLPVAAVSAEPALFEMDVPELPPIPGRLTLDDIALPGASSRELAQWAAVTKPIAAPTEASSGWIGFLPIAGGGGGGVARGAGASGGSVPGVSPGSDQGSESNPAPGTDPVVDPILDPIVGGDPGAGSPGQPPGTSTPLPSVATPVNPSPTPTPTPPPVFDPIVQPDPPPQTPDPESPPEQRQPGPPEISLVPKPPPVVPEVPEPGTLALMAAGLIILGVTHRRRKRPKTLS